ncbi:MAG: nucleoside triphosphate pyrophosphohydrolase family protein [Solirubrobacteraceae bacterium]
MPGQTQLRVRRTMLDAGGYWRPLAAVARLLEELGELSELLVRPDSPQQELAAELADLWIITAALADQYLAEVPEPGSSISPADALGALAGAVSAAGEIAPGVNYYDGPKTPRTLAALPTLAAAVAGFHDRLGLLAGSRAVDLAAAVDAKLDTVRARDMRRFGRERSDPSTAPVLDRLRTAEPDTTRLRLWGAPETDPTHALRAFLRAAGPERFDAFVVERDPAQAPDALGVEEDPPGARDTLAVAKELPAALAAFAEEVEAERRGTFLLLRRCALPRPGDDLA